MRRATTFPISTTIIKIDAAAHACLCQSSKGEMAYVKIVCGNEAIG